MFDLGIESSTFILMVGLTFSLSFYFSLSGLGAAGLLVPIFHWLGIPIDAAKIYSLLANSTSLSAATIDNFKSKRINAKMGLPIILPSIIFTPIGVYISKFVDTQTILWMLAFFLIFSGINAIIPKKQKKGYGVDNLPKKKTLIPIGIITGLTSGLLGIGGGGIISAFLIWMGCNPKKITTITAFAVPFSSLTGFLAYLSKGSVNFRILVFIGTAALLGGLLGNRIMHSFLPDKFIKYSIGITSLIFSIKLINSLI